MKALTALAIVTALGLGIVVCMQQSEITSLKKQLSSPSGPMETRDGDANKVFGSVIAERRVKVGNADIPLEYRCSGEVKKSLETFGSEKPESLPYCVGDYELVALISGQSLVVSSGHAADGNDAPVLMGAENIGDQGIVLVSFKPSCISMGDCGSGIPVNNQSFMIRTQDRSVQPIANVPPNGSPVWNPIHTKALFIPETCGGAGCDLAPVIGYDLASDRAKDLTKEKAVGLGKDTSMTDATDPAGDRLPVWKSVEWDGNDEFKAVMVGSDGGVKNVMGKF